MYMAMTTDKESVRIILTKDPISREALLTDIDPEKYCEVKIGDRIMYERASYAAMELRRERDTKPKFDGTGPAFCLVEPNVLVSGQANLLKAILERNKKAEFSEGFRAALNAVDLSRPMVMLGSFKE